MDTCVRVVLFITIALYGITCSEDHMSHCDSSTMVNGELTRTKLHVFKVNATSFEEPFQDYMPLDICLSNGTLRINWTMAASEGHDSKLCYEVKRVRNMNTVVINCYKIQIPETFHKSALFCWFEIERPRKASYIHAIVTQQTNAHVFFYTELYVSFIEISKKCNYNVCEESLVNLKHKNMVCDDTNKVYYRRDVRIEQVTFNSSKPDRTCSNSSIEVSRIKETELEFHLNCSDSGPGEIHIVYYVDERFCHVYFKTYLHCETGSSMSSMYTTSHRHQHQHDQNHQEITLWTTFVICSSVIITSVCVGVLCKLYREYMVGAGDGEGLSVIRRQASRSQHISTSISPASLHTLNNEGGSDCLNTDNDVDDVDEHGMSSNSKYDSSVPLTVSLTRTST